MINFLKFHFIRVTFFHVSSSMQISTQTRGKFSVKKIMKIIIENMWRETSWEEIFLSKEPRTVKEMWNRIKNLGLDWRFGLGYMQETKYGKLLLRWFWSNRYHGLSYKCHYQWDHQAAGLSRIKFCLHFASFGFKILSRILLGGTLDKVDWTSAIHWIIGQYEIFRNAPDNLYCHNIRISGCSACK